MENENQKKKEYERLYMCVCAHIGNQCPHCPLVQIGGKDA